jgi:hypothetical protein
VRRRIGSGAAQLREDLVVLGEPPLLLLREEQVAAVPDGELGLRALLDAGVDAGAVRRGLDSLGLPIRLEVAKVRKGGFAATQVTIEAPEETSHRHLPEVEEVLARGALTDGRRELALRIFRRLAQAEADRLAEEVKAIAKSAAANPDGVEKQLRDLAEQKKARKFELERLALLKFQHEATQARMGYERPKIDKSLVLYPTDNFADRLLELRKEPVGGVAVLADAPRTRFYVACEVRRFEKTIDQFRDVFAKVTATGPAHNPLYDQYALPEERGEAVSEVFARLRAEAGLQEKEALKNRQKRETE